MADQKQREVRMSGQKKPGNKPRMHRRAHKSLRAMWRDMAAWYQEGADARLAVLVKFPEREHDSKKPEREAEA